MSKTIVFPEPFESKLKKLKIKTRFINNLLKNKQVNGYIQDSKSSINEKIQLLLKNADGNWNLFISSMASWKTTPEGAKYWYDIAWNKD